MVSVFDRIDAFLDAMHGLFVGVLVMFALGVWAMETWQRRASRSRVRK